MDGSVWRSSYLVITNLTYGVSVRMRHPSVPNLVEVETIRRNHILDDLEQVEITVVYFVRWLYHVLEVESVRTSSHLHHGMDVTPELILFDLDEYSNSKLYPPQLSSNPILKRLWTESSILFVIVSMSYSFSFVYSIVLYKMFCECVFYNAKKELLAYGCSSIYTGTGESFKDMKMWEKGWCEWGFSKHQFLGTYSPAVRLHAMKSVRKNIRNQAMWASIYRYWRHQSSWRKRDQTDYSLVLVSTPLSGTCYSPLVFLVPDLVALKKFKAKIFSHLLVVFAYCYSWVERNKMRQFNHVVTHHDQFHHQICLPFCFQICRSRDHQFQNILFCAPLME